MPPMWWRHPQQRQRRCLPWRTLPNRQQDRNLFRVRHPRSNGRPLPRFTRPTKRLGSEPDNLTTTNKQTKLPRCRLYLIVREPLPPWGGCGRGFRCSQSNFRYCSNTSAPEPDWFISPPSTAWSTTSRLRSIIEYICSSMVPSHNMYVAVTLPACPNR